MRIVKKWILPLLVLAMVSGGIVYYYRSNTMARAATLNQTFATAVVRRDNVQSFLSGTASIVFSDRRTIQASTSGTLAQVLVSEGDRVEEGQLLAVIDNPSLHDQVEQAKTDLETARIRLETLRSVTPSDYASAESKYLQAEDAVASRRLDLEKLTVATPLAGRVASVKVRAGDTVSAGQVLMSLIEDTSVLIVADVAQADISKVAVGQSATAVLGTELPAAFGKVVSIGVEALASGRLTVVPVMISVDNPNGIYRSGLTANVNIQIADGTSVYATGAVAPLSRYDLKAQVAGTVTAISARDGDAVKAGDVLITLQNDSLQRALRYAENDLTIARATFERIQQGYAPNVKDTDIRQAESQLAQAQATLQARLDQVSELRVKAPISGIVIAPPPAAGLPVNSGTTLFVIADPAKMHMVVPVDELDVMQVKSGQRAIVTVDAIPGKVFAGTVAKVASEGATRDGIANYDVTVSIDDTTDLKGSMTGTATIVLAQKQNVLVVPSEAIRTEGRQRYVNLVKEGVPTRQNVTVGISSGRVTEIIEGLKEGDVVALSAVSTPRNTQQPTILVPGTGVPGGGVVPGGGQMRPR